MATLIGRGGFSHVYRQGDIVFKPFDMVAPSIKADQLIQFSASKTQLETHSSSLAEHVSICTVAHNGESMEAIVMPYTGAVSLNLSEAWLTPSIDQLVGLAEWVGTVLTELRRCKIVMLDWKLANILQDPRTGRFELCDWDSLITEYDACTQVDDGICPVAPGTYSPYCSAHPATFTVAAMRYATAFSAAITLCVARFGDAPRLRSTPTAKSFLARHQALKALLCSFLPSSPPWFSSPKPVLAELSAGGFFGDS
tara:strand:- start:152 stop:913 length:762 start_codon:yes stop_codon:yes gene_type:complete